ncbi:hypothetical protein V1264_013608 [Littorina saxatilis]|uniref:Uncharacterized protein n=1 Tax=Littorina saxatilis TaxID=31220 RepID=A0AAN9GHZ5_9CAEN
MCTCAFQVVSVMSATEQRRLILIAKQDCYKLSERREAQIRNGSVLVGSGCEVTWDDILCWDLAKPGTTVSQKCPDYINGFNRNGMATRYCTENGTWFYSAEHNDTWTNYSQCLKPSIDLRFHAAHGDRLRLLYTIGYSVSLGTLLIAVVIMFCCKRLHSKSNTLHINLFLAFILRALISFLKDALFVGNVGLSKDVKMGHDGILEFVHDALHWECKLLITVFMYSVSACNMWILAEALYLTMLVQRPLRTERRGVRIYVVLGWVLPFPCLLPWVIIKSLYENTFCWNIQHNTYYYWILRGSGVAVIVINLFLFLNIFRKLFMKLRHSSELGASGKAKYRKLAKFILVLIPLFGIMYLVFYVVVPSGFENNSFNVAYLYLEMTYNSFQGFLLALLFCFLNEEVHGELKRLWYRHRYRKGDPTAFTRSFAASSYRKAAATSSARSQTSALLPRASTLSLTPSKGKRRFSATSNELDAASQGLLSDAEKRRLRLQKARSHDLDKVPPRKSSREESDELLRQAIKTSAIAASKSGNNRKLSTVTVGSITSEGSVRFDEDLVSLTSQGNCVTQAVTSPNLCEMTEMTPSNGNCVTKSVEGEEKVVLDKNSNSSKVAFV